MAAMTDLTGKRFGRLTVLGFSSINKHHHSVWKCRCDCGIEKDMDRVLLIRGHSTSCGCKNRENKYRKYPQDLCGIKFGRLTALYDTGKLSGIAHIWHCRCDCGVEKDISRSNLTSGSIVSCGCYQKEIRNRPRTHGLTHTKEYKKAIERVRRERKKNLDSEWTVAMEIEIKFFFPECTVCGSRSKLAVDHVNSLYLGYGLKPGNAVILCMMCNSRKQRRPLNDLSEDVRIKIKAAAESFEKYWNTIKDRYLGVRHGRRINKVFREIHAQQKSIST
jgi:5-methylcytosine-specific restriction endonuclease McrA